MSGKGPCVHNVVLSNFTEIQTEVADEKRSGHPCLLTDWHLEQNFRRGPRVLAFGQVSLKFIQWLWRRS